MKIASFDIGKKNFSFCIEEFDVGSITSLPTVQYSERYAQNGVPQQEWVGILSDICRQGRIILLENHDITQNCNPELYLDPECFHNLNDLLNTYEEFWDDVDVFVIEKQMSFGKSVNTMALKLGQHCFSYFTIHYGRSKEIVEFPAYYKTQILGAEKKAKNFKNGKVKYTAVDKPARKKWAVNKAIEILNDREDQEYSYLLQKNKKKDDMADVICQLQAFKVLSLYDGARD